MHGRKLLTSLALGAATVVSAQNWTATDIDGVEHSIADYVADGKTVLVDLSAHWCAPCWAWHGTGIMEKMYEEFGPEGTNDLMVFFIDGSQNSAQTVQSTMALLEGATGSQGDWTAGTEYPIIGPNGEGVSVANQYDFPGYPTLFLHCPGSPNGVEIDRTSTWRQFYTSWRNACPSSFTNGVVDATLFNSEDPLYCPDDEVTVELHNQGTGNLTSATVTLMQGGTELSTVEWTGNLARWASADITFPGITVAGPTEYNAIISSPNGGLDEHPEGDEQHYELDVAPTAALATVNFELRTDQYANEITWKLFNPNGQVVAQDPAGNYTNNTTYNYWWNLDPSVCYKLEVYDSYGDGIFSPGFYKVKSGGATLIQGGSHGSVGREKFSTGLLVSVEENALEAGLSVFPNPTAGILNINLELPGAASVEYTVHDILGKVVLQRTAGGNQGSQQVSLDMSGLANGSYVLNVVADGMSASRLVNLSK